MLLFASILAAKEDELNGFIMQSFMPNQRVLLLWKMERTDSGEQPLVSFIVT